MAGCLWFQCPTKKQMFDLLTGLDTNFLPFQGMPWAAIRSARWKRSQRQPRRVCSRTRAVSQDWAVGGWECDARHDTPHFGIENAKICLGPIKGCNNPGPKFAVSMWTPSEEPLDVKECHMGAKYFHKPQVSTIVEGGREGEISDSNLQIIEYLVRLIKSCRVHPAEAPTGEPGTSTYHIFTEPTFTSWGVHRGWLRESWKFTTHRGWFSGKPIFLQPQFISQYQT